MTSLGQIANFVNGDRSSNYPSGEDFVSDGVPFISAADISEHGISLEKVKRISRASFERLRSGKIRPGDILFCLRGSLGKVGLVDSTYEAAIASSLVIVRPNETTDAQYLYYLLRSPIVQGFVGTLDNGSVQPNLSVREISKIEVPDFGIEEQRAIAHILGTLDDKIELNRKQNETLEAMARALFKAWFVDFEPVRAKMEGRWQRGQSLPGLPAHLYDLFPDRLVESELGEIPEGWRCSTIGEEVTVCGGSTPSTKEPAFWEGGQHCWATPKDLSSLRFPVLLDTERKITDAGLARISSGLLPVGTVLLSSRAPIGYLAITEVPTAINQGFIAMKCDGALPNVFVLLWCRENMDTIASNANGSTFLEISKSNFRPLRVVVPSNEVLTNFSKLAAPLYRQLAENEHESRTLAKLRDTLLPKLISGELRLKDAAKLVEAEKI